jgi:hypothetical protein
VLQTALHNNTTTTTQVAVASQTRNEQEKGEASTTIDLFTLVLKRPRLRSDTQFLPAEKTQKRILFWLHFVLLREIVALSTIFLWVCHYRPRWDSVIDQAPVSLPASPDRAAEQRA